MDKKKDIYWFPPVLEWEWKNFDRTKIVSIDQFIKDHQDDEFYIGTDSKPSGRYCQFSTSMIAYRNGTGGYISVSAQKTPDRGNMRPRLLSEAMRSLSVAYFLDGKIPKETPIQIHIDVNSDPNARSHMCKEELVGMILAQGTRFVPQWKPDAWGSTKVAHRGT